LKRGRQVCFTRARETNKHHRQIRKIGLNEKGRVYDHDSVGLMSSKGHGHHKIENIGKASIRYFERLGGSVRKVTGNRRTKQIDETTTTGGLLLKKFVELRIAAGLYEAPSRSADSPSAKNALGEGEESRESFLRRRRPLNTKLRYTRLDYSWDRLATKVVLGRGVEMVFLWKVHERGTKQ